MFECQECGKKISIRRINSGKTDCPECGSTDIDLAE